MIAGKRIPISEQSAQSLLWRAAACLFGLVILDNEALGPVAGLLSPKPVVVPAAQKAVEGDVWISNHWDPDSKGDYSLRMSDGRWVSLYCGPWPYDELCLHQPGLTPGQTYRLTVAYHTETLTGGVQRNIITHARLGQRDLVTPSGQAKAWRNVTTFYNSKRGRYSTLSMDAGFWTMYAVVAAIYAMLLWTFANTAVELLARRFRDRKTSG